MPDVPIHLTKPHIILDLCVTQNDLDGLFSLLLWIEGFRAAGKGDVPGAFELAMLYRTLRTTINQQIKDGGQNKDGGINKSSEGD